MAELAEQRAQLLEQVQSMEATVEAQHTQHRADTATLHRMQSEVSAAVRMVADVKAIVREAEAKGQAAAQYAIDRTRPTLRTC